MRDLNKFRGCLLGGAAGDALGYEVEFINEHEIFRRFGARGITEYALHGGVARISDDTQMTLFTANGLLLGAADGMSRGAVAYIADSYLDWLRTQFGGQFGGKGEPRSWLNNVPQMNNSRAPGNTCIHNLASGNLGSTAAPKNNSKGCGGVMRVAPVGLYFQGKGYTPGQVAMVAAEAAALTHGHELGFIPAAALAYIVYSVAHTDTPSLADAVKEATEAMPTLFPNAEAMPEFLAIMKLAAALSKSATDDLEAIHQLGEGWVAEEALAIAVYCALKYEDDFEKALIVSVNHNGDSDSTGAITGNILGALHGLSGIPEKYLENLELKNVIRELADDLYADCPVHPDDLWIRKYVTHTYQPQ